MNEHNGEQRKMICLFVKAKVLVLWYQILYQKIKYLHLTNEEYEGAKSKYLNLNKNLLENFKNMEKERRSTGLQKSL